LDKIKGALGTSDPKIVEAFSKFDNMISEVKAMSGHENIDLGMFSKQTSTMNIGDYQRIVNSDSKFR
jgi:hypothetical protein